MIMITKIHIHTHITQQIQTEKTHLYMTPNDHTHPALPSPNGRVVHIVAYLYTYNAVYTYVIYININNTTTQMTKIHIHTQNNKKYKPKNKNKYPPSLPLLFTVPYQRHWHHSPPLWAVRHCPFDHMMPHYAAGSILAIYSQNKHKTQNHTKQTIQKQ